MAGNYPDGVTGNEFQIAGADREWADERNVYCHNEECADFEVDKDLMVDLACYGSSEWGTFTCPTCGMEGEYEGDIEYDEVDPDYAYESYRDEH